jgi:DNA-directed RNA polymerase specialized sigma24 family protein
MSNGHYVTTEQLRTALQDYKNTGTISPRLTQYLQAIAQGVASKYGHDNSDDAIQETWILFLRHLDKVKIDKHPFNYLTTIAHNACRHAHRKHANTTRMMYDYFTTRATQGDCPQTDQRSFD